MADTGVAPWRKARLGDLCRMYQPETITKKQMNDGGAYPVYGANGVMGRHDRFNHDASQLIIGCRGACGTVHVTEPKSWITGNSMVIQPINGEADLHYLRYFFSGPADLPSAITGAAQPQITQASLKPIAVPLPPLEEQKRIVAVLDQAFTALDRARALAEANLADAEAFLTGVLADALQENSQRWDSYPLESFCIKGRKIGYGVLKPGRHDPQGVRLIKSQQVRDDSMDLTEDFRITKELDKQYARTRLQGGEILLNLVGASIGRSAIAPVELSGANISRAVAVLPVEPELAPWIQLNLRGPVGQRLIEEKTGGSAQPVLNLSEVKSLPIPLPSEKERADLLRKVENLSSMGTSLAQGYRTKIREVSDLRQSLLQKAFAGELT